MAELEPLANGRACGHCSSSQHWKFCERKCLHDELIRIAEELLTVEVHNARDKLVGRVKRLVVFQDEDKTAKTL